MALSAGDIVIPAGVFNRPSGGVADLTKGTLCPEGLNVGVFQGGNPVFVVWNSGAASGGNYSEENLRLVTPYTGPDLLGKRVTLDNVAPAFEGVVTFQFNTELDNVAGQGSQEPVVQVKAAGFYYLATPSSLEEI